MSTAALLLLLALASRPAQVHAPDPAQEPPRREGSVREEAVVERVVVDAHVLDNRGSPIPDLSPEDFRVTVDGKLVLLESAEWIPADVPETNPSTLLELDPMREGRFEFPPGRLLVFFFQTHYNPSRLQGLMRMALQARTFLDTLLPTDRVAVVSYDSHLKLRQDFTADHDKVVKAINAAIRTGFANRVEPMESPSLARYLDFDAARSAVTPEKGLDLIAKALTPIPGGKSLLYFGWGLGTVGGLAGPHAHERRHWVEALQSLATARVNIFTLDVTDADYHTLEHSIQQISDLTGGSYQKTHLFPRLALENVGRAISGRYVLVFVKPRAPRGVHEIEVELSRRKGRVYARQYYEG